MGLKVRQVGRLPFRYIVHMQWAFLNKGVFTLLLQATERRAPRPTVSLLRRAILRLRKILTGKPFDWEIPSWEEGDQVATTQESSSR